jgi:hypothetical protein
MPVMNGLDAAPLLRKLLPTTRIILFTVQEGREIERLARAGRSNHLISVTMPFGFRNKNNSAGEMRSFRYMFQCNPTRVPLRHTSKSLEGSAGWAKKYAHSSVFPCFTATLFLSMIATEN